MICFENVGFRFGIHFYKIRDLGFRDPKLPGHLRLNRERSLFSGDISIRKFSSPRIEMKNVLGFVSVSEVNAWTKHSRAVLEISRIRPEKIFWIGLSFNLGLLSTRSFVIYFCSIFNTHATTRWNFQSISLKDNKKDLN